MPEPIVAYYREIKYWRTLASVVWMLLLLPVVTTLFLFCVRFDILHPFSWISDCLWSVFSISFWLHVAVLGIALASLAIYSSSQFSVKPEVFTFRLAICWNIISPKHLGRFSAFALVGAVASWSCINIEKRDYVGLTKQCPQDEKLTCLNEPHLFVVLHGLVLGLMATLSFYINDEGYMSFQAIQQAKLFSVKSKLLGILWKSAFTVMKRMGYFYLLYFFLGSIPKSWIILTLKLSESGVALNSIRGLLDWSLLWHVWLSGTFTLFMFRLSSMLFITYQTQEHQFAVEAGFDEDSSVCLNNALGCGSDSFIQYVGFQDLFLLSRFHADRRSVLFSLSQPGGHPHNWNAISVECLAAIDNLTNSIVAYNNSAIANGAVRNLSGEKVAPTLREKKAYTLGPLHSDAAFKKEPKPEQTSLLKPIWTHIKKIRCIAYMVNELPDTTSRQLFADSQKHIWAIEALSHFIVASYTEDQYGVVQKSLADILTVMLNLLDAVDKHFILATNMMRRAPRGADHSSDVTLRFALRSALKSALYRIVIKFDKHLEFISLSPEHKRRLTMYRDMKE